MTIAIILLSIAAFAVMMFALFGAFAIVEATNFSYGGGFIALFLYFAVSAAAIAGWFWALSFMGVWPA